MQSSKKQSRFSGTKFAILAVGLLLAAWWTWSSLESGPLAAAKEAFAEGDYDAARVLFARAVAENPDDDESRYYVGVSHRHSRNDVEAVNTLTALRAAPEWAPRAFHQIIRTLIEAERLGDARAQVEQAGPELAGSPLAEEAKGLYHLAAGEAAMKEITTSMQRVIGDREVSRVSGLIGRILYAESSVYRSSLDKLIERLEERNDFAEATRLESLFDESHDHYLEASRHFEKAIALADEHPDRPEPVRAVFELATFAEFRKKDAKAESLRSRLIDLPEDRLADDLESAADYANLREKTVEYLAENLIEAGRYDDAVAVVERVRPDKSGRRDYAYEVLLAKAYDGMGDGERVLAITDRWLDKDHTLTQMNILKGKYYFDREEHDKAQLSLERAYHAAPSRREFMLYLARNYMALKSFDRANQTLRRFVDRDPDNWEAQLMRIEAMEGLGWFEEARNELATLSRTEFAERGTPGNRAIREYMDAFLARRNMLPTDLYQAKKLYTEDPNNFDAGIRYLEFLIEGGNTLAAGKLARDLVKAMPAGMPEHFGLAMACGQLALKRGDGEEAVKCFQRAASERPYEPAAFVGEARAFLALDRLSAAWRAMENVRTLAPSDPAIAELEFALHVANDDRDMIAATGQELIERGDARFDVIRPTARALIEREEIETARGILDGAKSLKVTKPDELLAMARMYHQVGRDRDSERLLEELARKSKDEKVIVAIARELALQGRDGLVDQLLTPIVADAVIPEQETIVTLAGARRRLGNVEGYLRALARLMDANRRRASIELALFCEEHGAYAEIFSIVDIARAEQALSPEILRCAARAALETKNVILARNFANELQVELGTSAEDHALVKTQIYEAAGEPAKAMQTLERALNGADPKRLRELRALQVELLGNRGAITEMMAVVAKVRDEGDDIVPLAPIAARAVLAAGSSNAKQVLDSAIESFGAPARALLDRGLWHMSRLQLDEAEKDLLAAWDKKQTADIAYARAHHLAFIRGTGRLNKMLRDDDALVSPLIAPTTRTALEFIVALRGNKDDDAIALARQLPARNRAENDAFVGMLERGLADEASAAVLRERLPLVLLFSHYRHTRRLASESLAAIEAQMPDAHRVIELMRSALYMGFKDSYEEGVQIVARLFNESDLRDEAALAIYVEEYLRNGQRKPMKLIVDHMMKSSTYSPRAYEDIARLLLDDGQAQDAARLLHHLSGDETPNRMLEARALFGAGLMNRAAALLESEGSGLLDSAEAQRMLAEIRLANKNGARAAFQHASKAVYGYPLVDAKVLLTLAKASFASDHEAEAWKNIERYLAWAPASAMQTHRALEIVNAHEDVDPERRGWLYRRLNLLDPAGVVIAASR